MLTSGYTTRRELEEHSFHPIATLLVPLVAILLQVLLTKTFPALFLLDLPLLVTVFFAVSRRSPIAGALTGMVIGLLEDLVSGQPIGINSLSKTLIGYIAASIGLQIDVEAITTRVVMIFLFSLLNSLFLYLIVRRLLGLEAHHFLWHRELIRATANTLVAIPLFLALDRAKRQQ